MRPYQVRHVSERINKLLGEARWKTRIADKNKTKYKSLKKYADKLSKETKKVEKELRSLEVSVYDELRTKSARIMDELILGDEVKAMKMLHEFETLTKD